MIFLTVGTVMPFDRLVKAVDEAIEAGAITEPIFAQIGRTTFQPKNMEYVPALAKADFDQKVCECACMISHAGIGSMVMGLEHGKPMLVMPRMRRYGEHVNDHQVATARKFGDLGHVLVAYDTTELRAKLGDLCSFVPMPRANQAERVARRIASFLEEVRAGQR